MRVTIRCIPIVYLTTFLLTFHLTTPTKMRRRTNSTCVNTFLDIVGFDTWLDISRCKMRDLNMRKEDVKAINGWKVTTIRTKCHKTLLSTYIVGVLGFALLGVWCMSVYELVRAYVKQNAESVFYFVAIGNSQMIVVVVVLLSPGMNQKYLFAFVSHFLSDWMSRIFESKIVHTHNMAHIICKLTSKMYSLVYSSLTWFFAFSFVDDEYTPQNIRNEMKMKRAVLRT